MKTSNRNPLALKSIFTLPHTFLLFGWTKPNLTRENSHTQIHILGLSKIVQLASTSFTVVAIAFQFQVFYLWNNKMRISPSIRLKKEENISIQTIDFESFTFGRIRAPNVWIWCKMVLNVIKETSQKRIFFPLYITFYAEENTLSFNNFNKAITYLNHENVVNGMYQSIVENKLKSWWTLVLAEKDTMNTIVKSPSQKDRII